MARWKPERKEATRQLILEAAAQLFRERGYADTSVSDVMEHIGLTVGGFYAHFESKEMLLSEVIAESMSRTGHRLFTGLDSSSGSDVVRGVTQRYLSRFHRDHPEQGCILPALAAEAGRHGDAPREAVDSYLREVLAVFGEQLHSGDAESAEARADGAAADELALAITALSVGGIVLARAVNDPQLSDAILRACRRFAIRDGARGRPNAESTTTSKVSDAR